MNESHICVFAGVGKTAIAEGIAQRMVAGDVPDTLKPPCRLVGLDLGALVAGASMRGEFEERLKSVLEEVTKSDGEIILFIDEMHTVVGAGVSWLPLCLCSATRYQPRFVVSDLYLLPLLVDRLHKDPWMRQICKLVGCDHATSIVSLQSVVVMILTFPFLQLLTG